ncbi:hypothetical protein [Synechococcus sp. PCC 7336]|nr:hypothetical protein [Synechococcus sp. PCC 7336]
MPESSNARELRLEMARKQQCREFNHTAECLRSQVTLLRYRQN